MSVKQLYGWNDAFQASFQAFAEQGLIPARVVEEAQGLYHVATDHGDVIAQLAGTLRFSATTRDDLPAVGDWVAMHPVGQAGDRAIIQSVISRQTAFRRKVAGLEIDSQIVAANIDTVMLVNPIDDINVRRMERYLSAAWSSGAFPVVVLTKADLATDIDACIRQVEPIALGAPVIAISAQTGLGMERLNSYLVTGSTIALLGLSGAGKSTLTNAWLDVSTQRTQDVRSDDGRGRHTTTQRTLFLLPSGAMVIDTPGMRELQLWDDGGIDDAFQDILTLTGACAFRDCQHQGEPGCAVQGAIASGDLPAERFANYQKMLRELAHLARKQSHALRTQERDKYKKITMAQRKRTKSRRSR